MSSQAGSTAGAAVPRRPARTRRAPSRGPAPRPRTTSYAVSGSSARTASRSRAKPASSRGGPPWRAISASSAAVTQSSSSAGTEPCGLWPSASLVGLSSRPTTPFSGDGTREQQQPAYAGRRWPVRAPRASPAPAARRSCPRRPARGSPATVRPPTLAGRTSRAARRTTRTCSPVRSTLGGGAATRSARTVGASCSRSAVEVLALGDAPAVVALDPEGHPQVVGHLGQVPGVARHVDAGGRPQLAGQRVGERLRPRRPGRSRAAPPRRVSGAGTKLRRSALGSDRISAVDEVARAARAPASRSRRRSAG